MPSKMATERPFKPLGTDVYGCIGGALPHSRGHHTHRQCVTGLRKAGFNPSQIQKEMGVEAESQHRQVC